MFSAVSIWSHGNGSSYVLGSWKERNGKLLYKRDCQLVSTAKVTFSNHVTKLKNKNKKIHVSHIMFVRLKDK